MCSNHSKGTTLRLWSVRVKETLSLFTLSCTKIFTGTHSWGGEMSVLDKEGVLLQDLDQVKRSSISFHLLFTWSRSCSSTPSLSSTLISPPQLWVPVEIFVQLKGNKLKVSFTRTLQRRNVVPFEWLEHIKNRSTISRDLLARHSLSLQIIITRV